MAIDDLFDLPQPAAHDQHVLSGTYIKFGKTKLGQYFWLIA
jgi:hypothetical protein